MILPSNKLIGYAALLGAPLCGVVGAFPEQAPLAVGLLGLFTVVAVWDGLRATGRLRGMKFTVGRPPRFARGRSGDLALHIHSPESAPRTVRLGIELPAELETRHVEQVCQIPAGDSILNWPLQARERGRHTVPRIHLGAPSHWGFWEAQHALPLNAEVRAYPDLFRDRAAVAAIFLNRNGLGTHAQRQVGKGRDFEKLREYISGDGLEDIHWKATAKRGRPVTKVYQVERTQEVLVVIDHSRLSGRRFVPDSGVESNGAGERYLDILLRSALLLGVAAERQGDHFGLITFADRLSAFIPAGSGAAHFAACREAVYTLEPSTASPDFEELATFIRQRVRRRSLILFLTSLDDPLIAESFVRGMDLLRNQHLLFVGMLRPRGVQTLFRNAEVNELNQLYTELAGHFRAQDLKQVELVLRRRGVSAVLSDGTHLTTDLIRHYMAVKQRQAL